MHYCCGWCESACESCQHELAGALECETKKRCKFVKDDYYMADPRPLLYYTVLPKFWEIFTLAVDVSPFDGMSGLPSVSMLSGFGVEIEIDEMDFWHCVRVSLNRVYKEIDIKRKSEKRNKK